MSEISLTPEPSIAASDEQTPDTQAATGEATSGPGTETAGAASLAPGAEVTRRTIPFLARWGWLLVLIWLGLTWSLLNYVLPGLLPPGLYMYLAHPLLWGALAALSFACWRFGLDGRPRLDRDMVVMAALVGACQVALLVVAGFIFGFGYSPYGHRLPVLLGNLLYAGTMLAGLELSRSYLVAVFGRRSNLLALVIPTLLLSFVMIPAGQYGRLDAPRTALALGGRLMLPTISENFLASFLALVGGPLPALAYRGLLEAFHWVSPILPNLEWIVTAFLGTLVPLLGLLYFYSRHSGASANEEAKAREGAPLTPWLIVAFAAILVLWFNTGLFGVQPTLVSGPSMTPTLMPGDVVITHDVRPDQIEVGDIVRFQQGPMYVLHRVLEVQAEAGQIIFITQGDFNNTPDPPVTADRLAGKVVLSIPKIGWVSIAVREALRWLGIG